MCVTPTALLVCHTHRTSGYQEAPSTRNENGVHVHGDGGGRMIQITYIRLVYSCTFSCTTYCTVCTTRAYRAKKNQYIYIFLAPSSRPLICRRYTSLESQEHGANSELSLLQIRGLKFGAEKIFFCTCK